MEFQNEISIPFAIEISKGSFFKMACSPRSNPLHTLGRIHQAVIFDAFEI
jgi:hypothetical protein